MIRFTVGCLLIFASASLTSADEKKYWHPRVGMSWIEPDFYTFNVSDVDVDVYALDAELVNAEAVEAVLDARRHLLCHVPAGMWEVYRNDSVDAPMELLGNDRMNGSDFFQVWMDIRNESIKPWVRNRIQVAADKGCHGVIFLHVDGYQQDTGFPITAQDQIAFNKWLAGEAHKLGMAAGMANAIELSKYLVDDFDFFVTARCRTYGNCNLASAWIDAGKPVFGVEYRIFESARTFCPEMNKLKFSWIQISLQGIPGFVNCLDEKTWTAFMP